MDFCQRHWDMLRQEVIDQGMGSLIGANSEIAALKLTGELVDGLAGKQESKDTFDPLMRAYFMIFSRTLDMVGLDALREDFGCPICFFNKYRNPDGSCPCTNPNCGGKASDSIPDHETWLVGPESCVTAVREMCVERGWIEA